MNSRREMAAAPPAPASRKRKFDNDVPPGGDSDERETAVLEQLRTVKKSFDFLATVGPCRTCGQNPLLRQADKNRASCASVCILAPQDCRTTTENFILYDVKLLKKVTPGFGSTTERFTKVTDVSRILIFFSFFLLLFFFVFSCQLSLVAELVIFILVSFLNVSLFSCLELLQISGPVVAQLDFTQSVMKAFPQNRGTSDYAREKWTYYVYVTSLSFCPHAVERFAANGDLTPPPSVDIFFASQGLSSTASESDGDGVRSRFDRLEQDIGSVFDKSKSAEIAKKVSFDSRGSDAVELSPKYSFIFFS